MRATKYKKTLDNKKLLIYLNKVTEGDEKNKQKKR